MSASNALSLPCLYIVLLLMIWSLQYFSFKTPYNHGFLHRSIKVVLKFIVRLSPASCLSRASLYIMILVAKTSIKRDLLSLFLAAKTVRTSVVAIQLPTNSDVPQVLDFQNMVKLEIECTTRKSCLVDINIIFPHIFQSLHFWCFINRQIQAILDMTHRTEWCRSNAFLLKSTIASPHVIAIWSSHLWKAN